MNVRHHFFAAQAVAPMMRDAGGGSIINLGSISAHIDLMDLPGYITAKAGVEGLTRTLAREYGPWHIRVNCIIPGWIMTEKQLTEWVTPEAEASIARNQCLPDKLYPDDEVVVRGELVGDLVDEGVLHRLEGPPPVGVQGRGTPAAAGPLLSRNSRGGGLRPVARRHYDDVADDRRHGVEALPRVRSRRISC